MLIVVNQVLERLSLFHHLLEDLRSLSILGGNVDLFGFRLVRIFRHHAGFGEGTS